MRSGRLMLYGAHTTLGWRIVRSIQFEEGERRVACGAFRRVHDSVTGKLLGYQVVGTAEARGDRDLPSMASPAAISAREMQANAGELGRSRTRGLAEEDRLSRRDQKNGRLLPAEDFVERTVAKIRVFPLIGAARGDILRAWPR